MQNPQHQRSREHDQGAIPEQQQQLHRLQEQREATQQKQSTNAWNLPEQQPKVVAAKNWVDELHEFVDKRNNVHKDIKEMVLKIRRALGVAVKDWKNLLLRVENAENELAAIKAELVPAVLQTEKSGGETSRNGKEKTTQMETTPVSTAKRIRSSPGDERPGGSKKQKDTQHRRMVATSQVEQVGKVRDGNGETPWRVVKQKKDKKDPQKAGKKPRPVKKKVKKKGEALVVKTSEESYLQVLRTIRSAPELKDLGEDVQKIRRTRAGDMIFELKKDSKNKSSSYKELTEKVVGDMAQVRAMSPEVTLECEDLDEITSEDEVKSAMKEQLELGDIEMAVRLRRGPAGTQVAVLKLPVDAAEKAMKIGKVKVGWSSCLLRFSQQPEMCFRCQGFGHLARNCKGPDRSKLCRRCGEEGHIAQGCQKPRRCLICGNGGRTDHATGGPKCPAFKQAMVAKSRWR